MEISCLFCYVCLYFIVNNMVLLYANWYSMHINCSRNAITIGNIMYEAGNDPGGSAKFFMRRRNGYSVALDNFGM